MSSQTPNINLTLPIGSEKVSRQIINDNNTKIDTAFGGTAGRELLGYKENGDTASQAIADGSFVVWKGSLYKANGAISQGTAFSGSNLTAVPSGGFNDLQGQVDTLSDRITNIIYRQELTPLLEPGALSAGQIGYLSGNAPAISGYTPIAVNAYPAAIGGVGGALSLNYALTASGVYYVGYYAAVAITASNSKIAVMITYAKN